MKKHNTVTCKNSLGRESELVVGECYHLTSINSELRLVYLRGFEDPFDWSRFEEMDK